MTGKFYRRIACLAAMLGLGVASSPTMQVAAAAPARATVGVTSTAPSAASTTPARGATGAGWGSMIGCAACAVGAGIIIAGGPGAVIAAANAPGSAIALMACAATCYEAFQ